MKKDEDHSDMFVLIFVFWFVFLVIESVFDRIGYPFDKLGYALFASWAWSYWPRKEK